MKRCKGRLKAKRSAIEASNYTDDKINKTCDNIHMGTDTMYICEKSKQPVFILDTNCLDLYNIIRDANDIINNENIEDKFSYLFESYLPSMNGIDRNNKGEIKELYMLYIIKFVSLYTKLIDSISDINNNSMHYLYKLELCNKLLIILSGNRIRTIESLKNIIYNIFVLFSKINLNDMSIEWVINRLI